MAGIAFFVISLLVYPGLEIEDFIGPVATALPLAPPWYDAVMYGLIFLTVLGALAVGYLARVKRLRRAKEDLPAALATDFFLSRLTYGAMAVWDVGETLDSIPSLMGLFGLRFMVYSGGVWLVSVYRTDPACGGSGGRCGDADRVAGAYHKASARARRHRPRAPHPVSTLSHDGTETLV